MWRQNYLTELEDQPWFPAILRRYMTDWMEVMGNLDPDSYAAFVERLRAALETCGESQLLDLCSGGAGPTRAIVRLLGEPFTATLTDLYPNADAFRRIAAGSSGRIRAELAPVDARAVPPRLKGIRLLANSFHHFRPGDARALLADAVTQRRGIALVEAVGLSPAGVLSIPLGILLCVLATPFLRPFRWSRLALTFLLPVVPLCALVDGVLSCFRVYSPSRLAELTRGLVSHRWDIGQLRVPRTPLRMTYLIGIPRE